MSITFADIRLHYRAEERMLEICLIRFTSNMSTQMQLKKSSFSSDGVFSLCESSIRVFALTIKYSLINCYNFKTEN